MRSYKIVVLALLCVLLSGCTQARQVESIAFAVILGADLTEEEGIELTVQIPKVGGGSESEESSSGEPSDYLIASARGATFTDALMALEITVPRDLTLTQIKLLVVSEALARHEKFFNFAESLAKLDQSCASAYFAVCRGNAGEFVREQKPVIGMRVSLGIFAMFEHHKTRGYIVGTSFADFYYRGVSVFSDPVAILCATAQEAPEALRGRDALDGLKPENVPASSENENEYVGTALFRDGLMVGTLDGLETSLLNAIHGSTVFFNYSLDSMPVSLQSHGMTDLRIENMEEGQLRIAFDLRFNVIADLKAPPLESIRATLREDLAQLLAKCQSLGVEPFGFAARAASRFPSLAQWQAYDWPQRFSEAEFDVDVQITVTDT